MSTLGYNYGSLRAQPSQIAPSNYYREERKTNLMNIAHQALGGSGSTPNSVYGSLGPSSSLMGGAGARGPLVGGGYNDFSRNNRVDRASAGHFGSKYAIGGSYNPTQEEMSAAHSSLRLIRAKMAATETILNNQTAEYSKNNRTSDTFLSKNNYSSGISQISSEYKGNNGPSSVNSNYGKKFVPERIIDKETNNIESELRELDKGLMHSKQRQMARLNYNSGNQQAEPVPQSKRANGMPIVKGQPQYYQAYSSNQYENDQPPHQFSRGVASPKQSGAPRMPQSFQNSSQIPHRNQPTPISASVPQEEEPVAKYRVPIPRKNEPESEEEEMNVKEAGNNVIEEDMTSQGDAGELLECPEGCGRKFNSKALKKHTQVCKKVFQQKRKKFNSKEQREVAEEQEELEKANKRIQQTIDKKKKMQKTKWKKESEAFQAQIKMARGEELSTKEKNSIQEAKEDSMVKCPVCGRNFNETAGARHIKFCEAKAKMNSMKSGPPKKAGSRNY